MARNEADSVSTPQTGAGRPEPPSGRAFDTAQRAFANGWIDLDDLDRRLSLIADAPDAAAADQAVADLTTVENRVARRPADQPQTPAPSGSARARKAGRIAVDLVFGLLLLAFVINLLVWGIIAVTDAPRYFWPVWMLIPLTVVGVGWGVVRWSLREERD